MDVLRDWLVSCCFASSPGQGLNNWQAALLPLTKRWVSNHIFWHKPLDYEESEWYQSCSKPEREFRQLWSLEVLWELKWRVWHPLQRLQTTSVHNLSASTTLPLGEIRFQPPQKEVQKTQTDLERDLPLDGSWMWFHLSFIPVVKSARNRQVYQSISNIFTLQSTCVFHKY